MTMFTRGVRAQVPVAPNRPVATDNVKAPTVVTLGGAPGRWLDGPLSGEPVHVDALRQTTTLARKPVRFVNMDVVVGALRLVEVVLDGDDGEVGRLGQDVHDPGPPVCRHPGRPEVGHTGSARPVVEADESSPGGAAGPALTELDSVASAPVH